MKRLAILRHAKSSWATPGLVDFDRPLNDRGREQLVKLTAWVKSQDLTFDTVICSSAKRTRETREGISEALEDAEVVFEDSLYEGSIDTYLAHLRIRESESTLLIGHNPTCDELVRYLSRPSGDAYANLMSRHFGTANIALLLPQYEELSESSCILDEYVTPKSIKL